MNKAKISAWGVGTQLVTAFDEPALGAVFKLTAIQNKQGKWKHTIKLSNNLLKYRLQVYYKFAVILKIIISLLT